MKHDNAENKAAEYVQPELVKCIKCGARHVDTYKYWLPICLECEKEVEEGDY